MKNIYRLGLLGIASLQVFSTNPSLAQTSNIIPDNTLGAESSQVIENFQGLPPRLSPENTETITGGAQRGINLFHSFQEFNISEGRATYFFSPNAEIQNILTRVTGNNPSQILGTLGSFGSSQPNLFLINPNGIVFGENASLDLQGSFVTTIANGIQFGEQGVFSATNPQQPPLLSVNPSALFFNQINKAAEISNSSITSAGTDLSGFNAFGLRVPNGKSLLLVGGNVNIDGGQLNAYGGRVEIGGLAESGNINLAVDGDNLNLIFPENVTRASVSFTNGARVYVEAGGGGDIAVNAENIEFLERSALVGGIGTGLGTEETVAGNISLKATGELVLDSRSFIINQVGQDAKGNGGNINIDANLLQMKDSASLFTRHNGTIGNPGNVNIKGNTVSLDSSSINTSSLSGSAGNVNLQTNGSVSLIESNILASVLSGTGDAGNIFIDAKSLLLTDNSLLGGFQGSGTDSQGGAGNITVLADDFITLDNSSRMSVSAFTGSGGTVLLETKKFNLDNASRITATVFDEKPAAGLTINATESVEITGFSNFLESGLFSETRGNGDAGDITINTGILTVKDGGTISNISASIPSLELPLSPPGTGKAGNIEINALHSVQVIGSTPNALALSSIRTTGNGGDGGIININTPKLTVSDGAEISASTSGSGKGGTIKINAPLSVEVKGTNRIFRSISSTINTNSNSNFVTADAGNIDISTSELIVADRAEISAFSSRDGKGGNINITSKLISLDNGAEIIARTSGDGKAGNISLQTDILTASNGSQINTSTSGSGDSGDIILQAANNIFLTGDNTGIFASTTENSTGKGGEIDMNQINLTLEDGAAIAVESQGQGIGGDIELEAGFLTLDRGKISADTRSNNGGDIKLVLQDLLLLRNDSKISTNAGNQQFGGNGGNISIDTPFIVALPDENSDITANAFEGRGGNVDIISRGIFGIEPRQQENNLTNDITVSSRLGIPGNLNITDPDDSNIRNNLSDLPDNQIDTDSLIANSCISRSNKRQENSFTITGTGGLRNRPGNELISQYSTGEVRNVEPTSRTWKKGDAIIEPTGVYKLSDGKILLSRKCGSSPQ